MSVVRSRQSWVRMADFPRLQVALVGTARAGERGVAQNGQRTASGCAASVRRSATRRTRLAPLAKRERALNALLLAAVGYQWLRIWRYTPAAPVEVERSACDRGETRLTILESNVKRSNRDARRLLELVRTHAPDVLLFAETDAWWCEQLEALSGSYPYAVRVPRANTYGLVLLSRLPLADTRVDYLIDPAVPSIQARVRMRDGTSVWLNAVHPRPPSPDKQADSLERDSELMRVAKRVRGARGPVVVCGDLNDVAWSRTTRLFQKISGLLDPRKGRGFYSTFPARYPGCRFPLDHFFHSPDFRLLGLRRLPDIGSDHLPMLIALSYEPGGAAAQPPVDDDADDWRAARRTLRAGASRQSESSRRRSGDSTRR